MMLKVKLHERSKVAGYSVADGVIAKNGRTLARPVRTRMYRGKMTSAWYSHSKRNESILTNAGFTPEEVREMSWGRPVIC